MTPLFLAVDRKWNGDFSTNDLSQWTKAQAQDASRLSVKNGWLSATVLPGDLNSNGARAEVLMSAPDRVFRQGDRSCFRWQTMFPADFQTSNHWHVWTQWHQATDAGSGVPLCFALHGETLSMRVQSEVYDRIGDWEGGKLWTEKLARGRVYDFVLNVGWSTGPDGFVELFLDGVRVVPKTGRATLAPDGIAYMKQGLYRHRDIGFAQTVLHKGTQAFAELVTVGAA